MFNFKKKLKEAGLRDSLVCLVNTKKISKDDLIHDHWKVVSLGRRLPRLRGGRPQRPAHPRGMGVPARSIAADGEGIAARK